MPKPMNRKQFEALTKKIRGALPAGWCLDANWRNITRAFGVRSAGSLSVRECRGSKPVWNRLEGSAYTNNRLCEGRGWQQCYIDAITNAISGN
jgi:hypothetical protein